MFFTSPFILLTNFTYNFNDFVMCCFFFRSSFNSYNFIAITLLLWFQLRFEHYHYLFNNLSVKIYFNLISSCTHLRFAYHAQYFVSFRCLCISIELAQTLLFFFLSKCKYTVDINMTVCEISILFSINPLPDFKR